MVGLHKSDKSKLILISISIVFTIALVVLVVASQIQLKKEENVVNFLERTGATVTRNGEDELSWREMHGDGVGAWEEVDFQVKKHLTNDIDSVSLDGASFNPQQIYVLDRLPSLTSIYCYRCPVDDKMAGAIGKLTQLETVDIGASNITNDGLASLSGLNLSDLDISETAVTDLSAIAGMTRLESLDLRGLDIQGQLKALSGMTNLRHLFLDGSSVRDEDLRQISHLTSLEFVHLNNTGVGNDGVSHLVGLQRLENFQIDNSKIDDGVFIYLDKMKGLSLVIASNSGVTREAEETFSKSHPGVSFSHRPAPKE